MRSPRRFPLALLAALLLVAPACAKDKGKPTGEKGKGSPSPTTEAAKVGFRAMAVQAVDAADRPQATEKANQIAPQVVDVVNSYYSIAFIDPGKWGDGRHPDLAGLFAGSVQPQVAGQIQGLALGDLAPKVKSVKPEKQELTIKVDVEDDLSTPVVSVLTAFEATAQTREKADGPLKIAHILRIYLAPDGGTFKITGGSAELKADTAAAAAGGLHEHPTAAVGGAAP